MASSMQDNINSIILSFINKAAEENGSNDGNGAGQAEGNPSSSSSPKNSGSTPNDGLLTQIAAQHGGQGSTEGDESPNRADNHSPTDSNNQDQPISGISLLAHPSMQSSMKRTSDSISSYDHQINPIDMDHQERKKQERKRERNRIAAAKCRERKMTKINTLENEVKQMQTQIKNYTIERDYYKNRCTRIVEMVNEYIKKGDKVVPISGIQQIIETITDDERERMHAGEPDEPNSKHSKYGM